MPDYIELFRIVLNGDGYHYLCRNNDGQFYFEHKKNNNNEALIFVTKELAQDCIDTYMSTPGDMVVYVPEFILYHRDHLPQNIIRGESNNGNTTY